MTDIDLTKLEAVMKLMTKFRLESITLSDGTHLVKKIHLGPKIAAPKYSPAPAINMTTEEDIMFGSTSAPKLSLDDFAKFSANIPKDA